MEQFIIFVIVIAVAYGAIGVGKTFYDSKKSGGVKDWTTVYKWFPNLMKK